MFEFTLFVSHFTIQPQCCGSGTGSVRIRKFWPDPDPIRNRNKHFGSGFESGSETGSEKNQKKEPYIQAKKVRWFHTIIHISHLHVVVRNLYMLEQTVWLGT
jgi:hypothetical protein